MFKNIKTKVHKESIIELLERRGYELNSETIKKLDNCFDSEIVSKLFFEITDAVIDKKEAVEIEKLINEKIK